MAEYYARKQFNNVTTESGKIRLAEQQLNVLTYVLANQLCRMDEPQFGCMVLSAMPEGEADVVVMKAFAREGDFMLGGMSGESLAEQSIAAAINFPDIEGHYTAMDDGSGMLWGNAYFDEDLSVLALSAKHGRLYLALQLSPTKAGEEYAREHLLQAYGVAVLALQHMMPRDDVLQSSCVMAIGKMSEQYRSCTYRDGFLDDLKWVQGMFERGQHPIVRQWKIWQEERPELKTYFIKQ